LKTAILLSTMGGPDSLAGVRPFLFHLFNDPAILRVPQPLRFILAGLISRARDKKAQEIYKQIGGRSPILENTKAQASALENLLIKEGSYRCFVGMSYAPPFLADAVKDIKAYGPDRVIILPLYPQYSTTTTASVIRDGHKWLRRHKVRAQVFVVDPFYLEEGFLRAQCETIEAELDRAQGKGTPHLLFSAHGLPEKIVRAGDPYPQQCAETARALADRLGLDRADWTLCYQSRVGPLVWIGPATDAVIERQAKAGRALIVVPLSFVSEHSETLVELGLEYRLLAERAGALSYGVAQTVGIKEAFIQGLAAKIQEINQKEL